MRNYAETCKDICGHNSVYNIFVTFCHEKVQLLGCIFHFSMGGRHFQNMFLSSSPYHLSFDIAYKGVWMFLFYKTILNLKTRLLKQNLKKILLFFHYHLNLFICCKAKLKIQFIFSRMNLFYRINCFTEWLFFKQNWIFWKGIQIFILNN